MRGLTRIIASGAFALGLAGAASAADLLVLAEDVPAGLNVDGAAIAIPTTQTGVDNLMEPLIYYQEAGVSDEGIRLFDFNKFEGRLAESWSFDEDTLTWTFNLRRGVKGCDGATFDRAYIIRGEPTRRRYDGQHKLDGWQYPNAVVWKDDLYVAYSINKEDVAITQIALKDLAAGP